MFLPSGAKGRSANSLLLSVTRFSRYAPNAVLVHGEYSLTMSLVVRLQSMGIIRVAATTRRVTRETAVSEAVTRKESFFEFVRFRLYETVTCVGVP